MNLRGVLGRFNELMDALDSFQGVQGLLKAFSRVSGVVQGGLK